MTAKLEHWIGGKSAPSSTPDVLVTFNPATGAEVAQVALGTREDLDLAVIAAAVRRNLDELAALEAGDTGKSMPQAAAEIAVAGDYFEYYAGLVNLPQGETIDVGPDVHCYTRREPFGVVGVITPWNSPLNQGSRGVAPALAAGNTVIMKPSEFTSSSSLFLARLATEVGFPDGVLNVVTGDGPGAGTALVEHPGVRKIAFTGSVRAGRQIGRMAAERMIPTTLELGGKSANIVFADADLDRATAGAVYAFALNAGQVCSAGTRLLVQRPIHDEFVERLAAACQELPVGGDVIGPMSTKAQYEKVLGYFGIAAAEGAHARIGGYELPESERHDGLFVVPTIYTGVDNSMRTAREEIFGPVLAVIPFDDEADAVAIANDSEYGLAAGLWTQNAGRALRVADQLEAGQVYVNTWSAGIEAPFGGYKQSGHGREKGLEALHHYTQVKCVTVALK